MEIIDKFLSSFFTDLDANRVELPTLPEVALQIRNTISNPDITSAKIEKILNTDPALSAKLLKVVNSPIYRGKAPITNLSMAITRLGVNMVRNLATSLVMEQLYQASATTTIKQRLRAQWLHSTHVATLSQFIAKRFTTLKPDEALLAGLIHDIGVLPILNRAELIPELFAHDDKLGTVCEKLHAQVGAAVLEKWSFSPNLVAVAAEHEQIYEQREGPVDLVDVVIVANLHSHLGGDHPLAQANWESVPALARLGLSPDASIALLEEARPELSDMQRMIAT